MAAYPDRPPLALPGFENIKRAWSNVHEAFAARLNPGDYYVTKNNECIYTTLGSCISACIRDRVTGVGGMNHFMLPEQKGGGSGWDDRLNASTRFGNYAMEHMINDILKTGGRRENLEAKVFGGGRILVNMTDVGGRNIAFVRDYLATEGIKLVSEDVGEVYPRMVVYFPNTGKVRVKRLRSLHNNSIVEEEKRYQRNIEGKPVGGEIELF